jgi:hypothetical protein
MSFQQKKLKSVSARRGKKQRMVPQGNGTGVVQKFSLMPRPFRAQEVRSFLVRTLASAAFNSTILRSDLAALNGVIARSATTSFFHSGMCKLVKIEVWAPISVAGTSVTTSIEWPPTAISLDFESPPVTFSDTSVSFDRPAHLQQHPPKKSIAREWWDTSSTSALINLICPIGSTVDFLLDWVMDDGLQPFQNVGPVLVGATPGQLYHHPVQAVLIPQSVLSL